MGPFITPILLLALFFPNIAAAQNLKRHPQRQVVTQIIELYRVGDTDALEPLLATSMTFRDLGLKQHTDRAGFIAIVKENRALFSQQNYKQEWIGTAENFAEFRGVWTGQFRDKNQELRRNASIELSFDHDGKITQWVDDFRRGPIFKPVKADGNLTTKHFSITFDPKQLDSELATQLGQTAETFYAKTATYLGKTLAPNFRLPLNVSDAHRSPYASDPGPKGFILIPLKSARRSYGFSMVHEFAHFLMGLSKESQNPMVMDGKQQRFGNRLMDEGFAVVVEEKLTDEPKVWPNFGQETHKGYWELRKKLNQPIWPVAEAEYYRSHKSQRKMVRLAYLQQGSFCKFLVERNGLEKFMAFFHGGFEAADQIYGKNLNELDQEWQAFLKTQLAQ